MEKFSNVTLFRQIALQNLQRKNLGFSETELDVADKDILLLLKSMEVGEETKLGSSADTVRKQMQEFYTAVA